MSDRGKRHAGYIKAEKCIAKTILERENEKKIEPMGKLKYKKQMLQFTESNMTLQCRGN